MHMFIILLSLHWWWILKNFLFVYLHFNSEIFIWTLIHFRKREEKMSRPQFFSEILFYKVCEKTFIVKMTRSFVQCHYNFENHSKRQAGKSENFQVPKNHERRLHWLMISFSLYGWGHIWYCSLLSLWQEKHLRTIWTKKLSYRPNQVQIWICFFEIYRSSCS